MGRHQIGRPEPDRQIELAAVEDRPRGHRGLAMAAGAFEGCAPWLEAPSHDRVRNPGIGSPRASASRIARRHKQPRRKHSLEADQALGKALHGACSCREQNKNILLHQPFQRNIWGDRIVMHKRFLGFTLGNYIRSYPLTTARRAHQGGENMKALLPAAAAVLWATAAVACDAVQAIATDVNKATDLAIKYSIEPD